MNWDQLAKSKGQLVRLRPPAKRFLGSVERPQGDEFWRIRDVEKRKRVELININTPHILELRADKMRGYESGHGTGPLGEEYGFLTLKGQVFIDGDHVRCEPL